VGRDNISLGRTRPPPHPPHTPTPTPPPPPTFTHPTLCQAMGHFLAPVMPLGLHVPHTTAATAAFPALLYTLHARATRQYIPYAVWTSLGDRRPHPPSLYAPPAPYPARYTTPTRSLPAYPYRYHPTSRLPPHPHTPAAVELLPSAWWRTPQCPETRSSLLPRELRRRLNSHLGATVAEDEQLSPARRLRNAPFCLQGADPVITSRTSCLHSNPPTLLFSACPSTIPVQ